MTNLIKEALNLSITMETHDVNLVYSPSSKSYFYDSSNNFNKIENFINQNLENIVAYLDDVKAFAVH